MSPETDLTPSLGDRVQMKFSCPNYGKGQVGTLTRFSGSIGGASWWVDFGVERHGSTGCWVSRSEFEQINRPNASSS